MYQTPLVSGVRAQVLGTSYQSQNLAPDACDQRPALLQILFFAITTAPMIATSSNNEAISKVNM